MRFAAGSPYFITKYIVLLTIALTLSGCTTYHEQPDNQICRICPSIDDRKQWDTLAESKGGKEFIKETEEYLARPEEKVDMDTLYLDFRKSGNREPYFKPYFRRMRLLSSLTFAECLENKGRFIKPLEKTIIDICSERTWIMPCHDLNLDSFYGRTKTIDLGVAHRGSLLVITYIQLGSHLSPEIRNLIREKVKERVINPFKDMVTGKRPCTFWLTCDHNWNAVCLANVLAAGIGLSETKAEQDFFIENGCKYIKNYLKGFPADGYCAEGTNYWNYGFSNYIYFSEIVSKTTGGKTDPLRWPEALKPALFPFRAEIINGTYPAFADCPYGQTVGQRSMGFISRKFGMGLTQYESSQPKPSIFSDLNHILSFPPPESSSPERKVCIDNGIRTWFNDAQILICRGDKGVKSSFGAVFKAGINDGNHSHRDIGSYSIVCGNSLIISDPGSEVYTKRTFSKDRFTSKVLNSYGHPVPVINGKLQKAGKDTQATVLATDFTPDMDTFSIDIKKAYDDPTLKKLDRTFRFDRKNSAVEIEDSFEFTAPGKFENALITFGKMEKLSDGRLKITDKDRSVFVEISSDCGHVSVSEEIINEDLPSKQKPLRIALKLDPQVSKGTVKARISLR